VQSSAIIQARAHLFGIAKKVIEAGNESGMLRISKSEKRSYPYLPKKRADPHVRKSRLVHKGLSLCPQPSYAVLVAEMSARRQAGGYLADSALSPFSGLGYDGKAQTDPHFGRAAESFNRKKHCILSDKSVIDIKELI